MIAIVLRFNAADRRAPVRRGETAARFRSLAIGPILLHQWRRLLVCFDDFRSLTPREND
jgi:hypothetical protein